MKHLPLLFLIGFLFCSCKTENKTSSADETYSVYYFHPTARCESCINIENFTKELIETKYSKSPAMIYKAINIEDRENEHFRKDYGLKFSSVVLSKTKNGKEEKFKLLDSIWSYSENKEGFLKYADFEIQAFIK
ncbi:MAG: nitrophenyl compound nitroreductase subunit ArsF family protein [Bacteroidetes bacterium]|nr:nitrophenyl compound nitroreductase subunit ArsF family protein [Bacteroidota bacterium]